MGKRGAVPIVQTIKINNAPSTPGLAAYPGIKGDQYRIRADALQEYVNSGGFSWYRNYLRSLPIPFDDITGDFGDDLYEKMMFDTGVAAAVNTLRTAILAQGLDLKPAVDDQTDGDWARSKKITDFCMRALENCEPGIDDVLWNMLDALAFGNRIAEIVWEYGTGKDSARLVLSALKVKPRHNVAFVTDVYNNVIGMLGLIPGRGAPIQIGTILSDPTNTPNFLPRSKFAVLTYRPKNNDPRGSSILRPAYTPWWQKQQIWPEYLKFLTQFATPLVIGITPEHAMVLQPTDADGNPTGPATNPEQLLLNQLLTLRNSTALAVPFGTEIKELLQDAKATAFIDAIALYDRQISKGILHQTLATDEGQHESRAAAVVHQDILGLLIRQGKRTVERMLRRDILTQLVVMNFGERARAFIPYASLGEVQEEDWGTRATATAALLQYGYFTNEMMPEVDSTLGFQPRTPDDTPYQPAMAAMAGQGGSSDVDRLSLALNGNQTPGSPLGSTADNGGGDGNT